MMESVNLSPVSSSISPIGDRKLEETILLSGTGNLDFAERVSKNIGVPLTNCDIKKFANEEIGMCINESVRGKYCFVIQSTAKSKDNSPNDNLMELFIMIDALRRGSAREITVIIPYYAYSRQDRKDYSRAPISASMVAQCLTTLNINRVVVYDLHAGQIGGFFPNNVPLDNLYVEPYFINDIKNKFYMNDVIIVAPDEGACKRAARVSVKLGCDCATIYKERKVANKVDKMVLFGSVKDKHAILVDDIIDTGGTACKAASILKEQGAKSVYMYACHGLLSRNAVSKINNSDFDGVIITNTVYIPESVKSSNKINVLDVSKLCARVIHNIIVGKSVSRLYSSNSPEYVN